MKKITLLFLFIVLLNFNSLQTANAETALSLTLKKAVQLALENNPGIKGIKSSLAANREKIKIAESFLLPRVFVQENAVGTNDPAYVFSLKLEQRKFSLSDLLGAPGTFNNPNAISDFKTSLFFEEPIFSPAVKTGIKAAELRYKAERENFYHQRQELAFQVVQTWLMVKTAREDVGVAEKGVHDAKQHFKLAEKLYKAGIGLYSDTLRAFTAVKRSEQNSVQASTRYQVAKLFLGYLLGLNHPVNILAGKTEKIIPDHLQIYTAQWVKRDDLKSLFLSLSAAKAGIHLAEERFSPTVRFEGSYNLHNDSYPFGIQADDWEAGIVANLNLFEGGNRKDQLRIAQDKQKEMQDQLIQFKNAIQLQVQKAYLRVIEAKKNIEFAKAAVKSAKEGVKLVQLRYQNSLSPFLDLLDAQLSLNHSRVRLAAAENQYLTAVFRFLYQSGVLLKTMKIK